MPKVLAGVKDGLTATPETEQGRRGKPRLTESEACPQLSIDIASRLEPDRD